VHAVDTAGEAMELVPDIEVHERVVGGDAGACT
jgi:hypothetical protein